MHAQLKEYCAGFTDLKDEATTLVADVDPATLQAQPDPDTWSAVQCIDHLNTAGWLLLRSMEKNIQRAQAEGPYGEPPFDYGFVSRWFVHVMEPSSGWTFDAPPCSNRTPRIRCIPTRWSTSFWLCRTSSQST